MRNLIAFGFLVLTSGFVMAQENEASLQQDVNGVEISNNFEINVKDNVSENQKGMFFDIENMDLETATIATSSSKNLKMVYTASNLFYIHNYALA